MALALAAKVTVVEARTGAAGAGRVSQLSHDLWQGQPVEVGLFENRANLVEGAFRRHGFGQRTAAAGGRLFHDVDGFKHPLRNFAADAAQGFLALKGPAILVCGIHGRHAIEDVSSYIRNSDAPLHGQWQRPDLAFGLFDDLFF